MTTFLWIFFGGILMSAIALVGSVTLVLREETLKKLLLPLVALASGTLLGGALFHMIPASVDKLETICRSTFGFCLDSQSSWA
jgi:zinc and cadmium transporter